ncbi:MAG: hypothetical protein HC905_18290 [Bacteroidales bacterium]|nr:hypothetical protein [Bacteroidales bacterium]
MDAFPENGYPGIGEIKTRAKANDYKSKWSTLATKGTCVMLENGRDFIRINTPYDDTDANGWFLLPEDHRFYDKYADPPRTFAHPNEYHSDLEVGYVDADHYHIDRR